MSLRASLGDTARAVPALFRVQRGAVATAALVVLLGGATTLLEGLGIVMILPFLERLIGGPGGAASSALARLPRLAAWLEAIPPERQLLAVSGLILGAGIGREALAYAGAGIKQWLSMRIADVFRAALHDALVTAQLRVSSRYHHGYHDNLLLVEANRIRSFVMQVLVLGETVVVMLTVLAIMAAIAPALTAAVVALMLAVTVPVAPVFRAIHQGSHGRMDSRVALMNYLAELMPFLATVHVLGGQARERARFGARYREMFRQDMRLVWIAGLIGPGFRLLGMAGVLGFALAAVLLARETAGTAGWVIPFVLLFVRLLPVTTGLNHALGTIGDSVVAFRKFTGEIEYLRAHRMTEGTLEFPARFERLELQGVWASYDGETDVLRDVSLAIPRGAHVAFTGPSGSGKSTLCLLLCRLYDPTKGDVLVDGVRLADFRLASLRRAITLVEQSPVLLNDTIAANIRYGKPDATDAEVRRAAEQANVTEFVAELPGGWDANVGNLGTAVSGGQRQRIVLARALLLRPQVLVLDEATSAVDARSEQLIRDAVERLRGETTVISVAHRLSTIRDADRIYFMRGGRIVASGTFAELFERSDEFRDHVRAQELSP